MKHKHHDLIVAWDKNARLVFDGETGELKSVEIV